jgi:hypothetical protein
MTSGSEKSKGIIGLEYELSPLPVESKPAGTQTEGPDRKKRRMKMMRE